MMPTAASIVASAIGQSFGRQPPIPARASNARNRRRNAALLAMENADPITPETFSDAFARHAKAAGLPPIWLHDLRHSYATAALTAGVPAQVVSERLGHAWESDHPRPLIPRAAVVG
jgi:integrase